MASLRSVKYPLTRLVLQVPQLTETEFQTFQPLLLWLTPKTTLFFLVEFVISAPFVVRHFSSLGDELLFSLCKYFRLDRLNTLFRILVQVFEAQIKPNAFSAKMIGYHNCQSVFSFEKYLDIFSFFNSKYSNFR